MLNGIIQEYHVSATPVSSYSLNSISSPMEWTFPNNTRSADLTGLQPGNQYNITIWARTIEGHGTPVSAIYNTEIGGNKGFINLLHSSSVIKFVHLSSDKTGSSKSR